MSATRLYYLHPLLAGSFDAWPRHLDRAVAMGFDAVAIAPPFLTGATGDLFLTADHDRLDERLGSGDAARALRRFVEECCSRDLWPMLDVVIDRVAIEHTTNGLADWYRAESSDELPDPRRAAQLPGVARLSVDGDLANAIARWVEEFSGWVVASVADFRCLRPHLVPEHFWHELITALRRRHPQIRFMAATFGIEAV
jgi:starch synthase (maltosyl-transferring)